MNPLLASYRLTEESQIAIDRQCQISLIDESQISN
jgi:hypothetical protein